MKNYFLLFFAIVVAGCTNIKVQEADPSLQLSHVCIENNSKVIVGDFLPVVRKGFIRHGITTEVYKEKKPNHCKYHLTYTALKTWDVGTYMHHAELQLYQGINPIAYAEYHLAGKGGLALNKWASVESKMGPVIDKLLINYTPEIVDSYRKPVNKNASPTPSNKSTAQKLRELKKLFDEGLITAQEYSAEKKKVLNQ
ncbi:MAG: Sbal_3080 family lipoprotein [Pseudomonadota bacterium]